MVGEMITPGYISGERERGRKKEHHRVCETESTSRKRHNLELIQFDLENPRVLQVQTNSIETLPMTL
jgi:hypothetical protein